MVARAAALGNYDPSLYLRALRSALAGSDGGRDAGGRHVAGGYERADPAAFADGGG